MILLSFPQKEADAEDQDFLTGQFMEYKKKLLTVIDPELHSRSSELLNAHSILSKLLIQMLLPDPTVPNKFIIKSLVSLQFLFLKLMLLSLFVYKLLVG